MPKIYALTFLASIMVDATNITAIINTIQAMNLVAHYLHSIYAAARLIVMCFERLNDTASDRGSRQSTRTSNATRQYRR